MLECMDLERSTYYDRKKEAVLLFGLSLWGNVIPMMKQMQKTEHSFIRHVPVAGARASAIISSAP